MCFPAGKNIVTEIREVIPGLCTRLDWISVYISGDASRVKEKSEDAPCIDDNKFYRNPNSPAHNVWSPAECAKYYLCLGNCPDYVSLARARRIIFFNHTSAYPFHPQTTRCSSSDAPRDCCSMFPGRCAISKRTWTTATWCQVRLPFFNWKEKGRKRERQRMDR